MDKTLANTLNQIKEKLDQMDEKLDDHTKTLDDHTKTLDDHTRRLEALAGDVEGLRNEVIAGREKQGLFHSRNKREIDEIKTHLEMPLIPDSP